jgi:hypothetical protein
MAAGSILYFQHPAELFTTYFALPRVRFSLFGEAIMHGHFCLAVLSILLSLVFFPSARERTSIASFSSTKPECPTVAVECPDELPETGKTYTVTARVAGDASKDKLAYHWSLSSEAGQIVDGQGTSSIKVLIRYKWESLTVAVEVSGPDDKCAKTATCTFVVE